MQRAAICLAICIALVVPNAFAAGELFISCDGTAHLNTGVYLYTLQNTGTTPQTLTMFYVGTMDTTAGNYFSWVAPAGFTATGVVADWTTLFNVYGASVMAAHPYLPHGTVMIPGATFMSLGGVLWTGSVTIQPGATVSFGFTHGPLYPYYSHVAEWFAEHPSAANSSQAFVTQPVAGPVGTYTQGFVHCPSQYPVPVEKSTFGKIKALYR